MSEFTEDDIQGKAGREALAKALADGINEKMPKLEGFGGVENVLLRLCSSVVLVMRCRF